MFRVFVAVLLSMGSFETVAGPAAAPDPIAITHVNVLPMTPAGAPLNDMTVTIRNRRIAAVIANGHYLPRVELDLRMKRIADRIKAPAAD